MNPCMKMPLTVFHFATTLEDLLQDEMYMEADGVDEHSVCEIIERIQALKPGEVVVVAGNDHFVETLQTHVLNYRDSNGWLWAVALR